MIAKNKEFKIEKKRLIIHREQLKRQEQHKQNMNNSNKPLRKYSREKKLSHIEKIEHFENRSAKRITSSKCIRKSSNLQALDKNTKELLQIYNYKDSKDQIQQQKIHLIGRNQPLHRIISDLVHKLKQKQMFQSHLDSYLIDKNYFVHIIEYLISILSTNDLVQCNRLFHKLREIQSNMLQIYDYACSNKTKEKNDKFGIVSNIYYQQFTHESFEKPLQEAKKLLSSLKVKEIYNQQLSQEINKKKIIIEQVGKKCKLLAESLEEKEKQLAKLNDLMSKFDHFAQGDAQIINQISKEFKSAQNNFRIFISNIEYDCISQLTLNNEERKRVETLKECIFQMRSWVNSWNIRQQILNNTKKQFVNHNSKIVQYFQQMSILNKSQASYKTLQEIKYIFFQIAENYKLASLFY